MANLMLVQCMIAKILSEYDQELPQSPTADNPVAPQGRVAQPSRDTRKTGGLNAFYWYESFALDSAVVEVQEMQAMLKFGLVSLGGNSIRS